MILKLNNKDLSKALKTVSPAIASHFIIPITGYVKIVCGGGEAKITATNTELTITSKFECDETGEVVIPFNKLSNICNVCSGEIEIHYGASLKIISGIDNYDLGKSEDVKNFPTIPTLEQCERIEVDGSFYYTLTQAAKSTHKEPLLNTGNVYVCFGNESIVASYDGVSMYLCKLPIGAKNEMKAVVPTSFIKAVKSFQSSTVSISDRFIKSEDGSTEVIGRLYDGSYMDIAFVLAKETKHNCIIKKDLLISSLLKCEAIGSTHNFFDVKLNLGEKLQLSFYDYGTEQSSSTEIEYDNKSQIESILLNSEHLKKVINQIDDDLVCLRFESASSPVVITSESTTIFIQPLKQPA